MTDAGSVTSTKSSSSSSTAPQRLRAWELRERLKNKRKKQFQQPDIIQEDEEYMHISSSNLTTGTGTGTDHDKQQQQQQHFNGGVGNDSSLPPAFRMLQSVSAHERRHRRPLSASASEHDRSLLTSSSAHSRRSTASGSNAFTIQHTLSTSTHSSLSSNSYPINSGATSSATGIFGSNANTQQRYRRSNDQASQLRRSNVFDALDKYTSGSTVTGTDHDGNNNIIGNNNSMDSNDNNNDDDESSMGSFGDDSTHFTLASEPPVSRRTRNTVHNLLHRHLQDRASTSTAASSTVSAAAAKAVEESLNLSAEFSTASLDFMNNDSDGDNDSNRSNSNSGGGGDKAPQQDPSTQATDEQWARFKLLGRIAFGDIVIENEQVQFLIDRNVSIMEQALQKLVALRTDQELLASCNDDASRESFESLDLRTGQVLQEIQETVEIPNRPYQYHRNPKDVVLDLEVQQQLKDYMEVISKMYRDNPFHNFEHASHVCKSVHELLKHCDDAVVNKDDELYQITTDPWTQFALVYAAIIHDVDHSGVPNLQLIKEKTHVANAYQNKSVAEQNSVELAWNLLLEPCYSELRKCIFSSSQQRRREEVSRFRSLVVTAVMATDIADKELAALRKGRAADIITGTAPEQIDASNISRRKATFVLETLIQAADVSHTMQPFRVYKRWNRKLYREMHAAYQAGRAEKDPTDGWYQGDIGFFKFYIVPLAKKLELCGLQCVDKYVQQAESNCEEWTKRGEGIVSQYVAEKDNGAIPRTSFSSAVWAKTSLMKKRQMQSADLKEKRVPTPNTTPSSSTSSVVVNDANGFIPKESYSKWDSDSSSSDDSSSSSSSSSSDDDESTISSSSSESSLSSSSVSIPKESYSKWDSDSSSSDDSSSSSSSSSSDDESTISSSSSESSLSSSSVSLSDIESSVKMKQRKRAEQRRKVFQSSDKPRVTTPPPPSGEGLFVMSDNDDNVSSSARSVESDGRKIIHHEKNERKGRDLHHNHPKRRTAAVRSKSNESVRRPPSLRSMSPTNRNNGPTKSKQKKGKKRNTTLSPPRNRIITRTPKTAPNTKQGIRKKTATRSSSCEPPVKPKPKNTTSLSPKLRRSLSHEPLPTSNTIPKKKMRGTKPRRSNLSNSSSSNEPARRSKNIIMKKKKNSKTPTRSSSDSKKDPLRSSSHEPTPRRKPKDLLRSSSHEPTTRRNETSNKKKPKDPLRSSSHEPTPRRNKKPKDLLRSSSHEPTPRNSKKPKDLLRSSSHEPTTRRNKKKSSSSSSNVIIVQFNEM
eukprot:CAMPEP_0119571742 /NCGR_PEP_ID=MMETSP1352-20130426/44271_1 /TAXON_ID=265584 /ORGANISM="Stauroneis constricta, Strain CCMP1120" /LENGTH=1270 /DNA_ID=CAMNT_0007621425 /DNA_START=84 /DNA_END=3894 /DNA_ORIENTATION=-